MAKKLIAVTDVRHDGDTYPANSELPKEKFTPEQLKELYDNGAVKVEDAPDTPDTSAPQEPTGKTQNQPNVALTGQPAANPNQPNAESDKAADGATGTPAKKATDTKKTG